MLRNLQFISPDPDLSNPMNPLFKRWYPCPDDAVIVADNHPHTLPNKKLNIFNICNIRYN